MNKEVTTPHSCLSCAAAPAVPVRRSLGTCRGPCHCLGTGDQLTGPTCHGRLTTSHWQLIRDPYLSYTLLLMAPDLLYHSPWLCRQDYARHLHL